MIKRGLDPSLDLIKNIIDTTRPITPDSSEERKKEFVKRRNKILMDAQI